MIHLFHRFVLILTLAAAVWRLLGVLMVVAVAAFPYYDSVTTADSSHAVGADIYCVCVGPVGMAGQSLVLIGC